MNTRPKYIFSRSYRALNGHMMYQWHREGNDKETVRVRQEDFWSGQRLRREVLCLMEGRTIITLEPTGVRV